MSSPTRAVPLGLRLPACERCRIRKVKCDSNPPRCGSCKRNDSACIIVDPLSRERYTRDGLYQLEQKLKFLEDNAGGTTAASPVKSPSALSAARGTRTHFVGDGSGLQFFKQISTGGRAVLPPANESPAAQNPSSDDVANALHGLPPPEVAEVLANQYLAHVQLHHPLLAEHDVLSTYKRVYDSAEGHKSPHDLYRLYMIFAIASVTTYRRSQTQYHPYGYFRAAQRYALQTDMVGNIQGIQNVLLVARFSMYYHVDCSIWDLARFCVRQCIALDLHRPPSTQLSALDEQLRRNVFWDCYIHDRYSSGILGRPYAIAEEDIAVELPVEMSEEEIASLPSLQNGPHSPISSHPNKASVFRFVVTLRRLLTRISNRFYTSDSQSLRKDIAHAARVKNDLNRFLAELDGVRMNAPVFSDPNSIYERSQWYDFLVEKDKLTLIRGAIAQMPVDGLHPPRYLLLMSMKCATEVLDLYNTMFSAGHITWTRSYFQIMFTSGLSIMYTISILKPEKVSPQPVDDDAFAKAARALTTTSDLMQMFVSEMPDAGRFAVVFDMLVKQYTGTGTRARPSRGASPMRDYGSTSVLDTRHRQTHGGVDSHSMVHLQSTEKLQNPTIDSIYLQDPNSGAGGSQSGYDFTYGFDFDDFPNWSMHPGVNDNILGQVEASLGEYAWGMPPDDSVWAQWDAFQGMS